VILKLPARGGESAQRDAHAIDYDELKREIAKAIRAVHSGAGGSTRHQLRGLAEIARRVRPAKAAVRAERASSWLLSE
jgi:hypothetical protein